MEFLFSIIHLKGNKYSYPFYCIQELFDYIVNKKRQRLSRGRSISICLYEKNNVVTWKWLPGKCSFAVLASLHQELSLGESYFFIWIYYNTLFGTNKPKSAAMVAKYPNKMLNKMRKKTNLFFHQIDPPRCFQILQKYPPPSLVLFQNWSCPAIFFTWANSGGLDGIHYRSNINK